MSEGPGKARLTLFWTLWSVGIALMAITYGGVVLMLALRDGPFYVLLPITVGYVSAIGAMAFVARWFAGRTPS